MGVAGTIITFFFIGLEILPYVFYRMDLVSPFIGIVLVLATFGMGIWLLPYLCPMRLKQSPGEASISGMTA